MRRSCEDCRTVTEVEYTFSDYYDSGYRCEWCRELRTMQEANAPVPSRWSLAPDVAKDLVLDMYGPTGLGITAVLLAIFGACICIPLWAAGGIWWPSLLLISLFVLPVAVVTEKEYRSEKAASRAELADRWGGWSGRKISS